MTSDVYVVGPKLYYTTDFSLPSERMKYKLGWLQNS